MEEDAEIYVVYFHIEHHFKMMGDIVLKRLELKIMLTLPISVFGHLIDSNNLTYPNDIKLVNEDCKYFETYPDIPFQFDLMPSYS